MPSLASLVVDLQVQSAQMRQGLDEANAKLDGFAKKAEGAGKLLSQAFSVGLLKEAGERLAAFVARGAELADQMGNLAQAAGAPVEQFSRLAYAAGFTDVSAQELSTSLKGLGRNMTEAFAGSAQAGAVFRAMGISVTDASGRMRGAQDVMGDLAEQFSGMADGAAKSTLAQELFGKSGADLIPLLNEGRDALAAAGDEADRFGLTVTEAGAAAAGRFNDSIERMQKVVDGVAIKLAQAVAPAFTRLAQDVHGAAGEFGFLDGVVQVLSGTIKGLLTVGSVTGAIFQSVGKSIAGVVHAIELIGKRNFAGALDALQFIGEDLAKVTIKTAADIKAIWSDPNAGLAGGMKEQEKAVKRSADAVVRHIDSIKKAEAEHERAQKAAAAERERAAERAAAQMQRVREETAKGRTAIERAGAVAEAEAADRRSRAGGAGGAGFEAALQAMVEAAREEAHWEAQARVAEKEGNLELQGEALKLADQFGRTADEARKAADALLEVDKQARTAQAAMISKAIGPVQGLIDAGAQGAAAGAMVGPVGAGVGAAVGVGLELLAQSAQFSALMDSVGEVIQTVADALGTLIEPLIPFAQMLVTFTEALSSVLIPVFKLLEPVFKFLEEVVRGFMTAVLTVADFIVGVINGIAGFFGFGRIDDSGIKAGLDKLRHSSDRTAESTEKLGKAAESATEEILNAPKGFKGLAGARWAAADMEGGGSPVGGGGQAAGPGSSPWWRRNRGMGDTGGGAVEVHINADLAKYVQVESKQRNFAGSGSTRPVTVGFSF